METKQEDQEEEQWRGFHSSLMHFLCRTQPNQLFCCPENVSGKSLCSVLYYCNLSRNWELSLVDWVLIAGYDKWDRPVSDTLLLAIAKYILRQTHWHRPEGGGRGISHTSVLVGWKYVLWWCVVCSRGVGRTQWWGRRQLRLAAAHSSFRIQQLKCPIPCPRPARHKLLYM